MKEDTAYGNDQGVIDFDSDFANSVSIENYHTYCQNIDKWEQKQKSIKQNNTIDRLLRKTRVKKLWKRRWFNKKKHWNKRIVYRLYIKHKTPCTRSK